VLNGQTIHQVSLSKEYRDENVTAVLPELSRIKNLFTEDFGVMFPQETIESDHNLFEDLMIAYHNQPPINGWMGAALSIGGGIVGYLCAKDKVEAHFSEDEKNLLIQLTLTCSAALENQKLSSFHTFQGVPSVL
jgi:GAF domain-containing protein